jgi:hypothetical protein
MSSPLEREAARALRPGLDLLDELRGATKKHKHALLYFPGRIITIKITSIEMGVGLVHGLNEANGQDMTFRGSQIEGFSIIIKKDTEQ